MKLGQHFLKDEKVLKKIANYVSNSDIVFEIGAGYGNLTKCIKARKIYAVEIDKKLFEKLKKVKGIIAINGDIKKIEFPRDVTKIVGNIPYSLSSIITEKVLKFGKPAILMYQNEFAERLVAKPCQRNYSRISVLTRALARVRILEYVKKEKFYPIPKVDSALVEIIPNGKKFDNKFFDFVRILFTHKNKKVSNALYDMLRIKIKEDKRVRCLDIDDIYKLMKRVG